MLPPMQLAIELELTPDTEVLYDQHRTARLVTDRFYVWVPRLELRDSMMTKYISEFQNQLNGLICEIGIRLQLQPETAVILESEQALTE